MNQIKIMNLFLLATTIRKCAEYHCDKHCIKMILELTQMLYSAWWFGRDTFPLPELDPLPNDPYRPTHKNHPVSVWVRADAKHYDWALNLAFSLVDQYYSRYGKIHACCAHLERLQALGAPPHIGIETYQPPLEKRATTGLPEGIAYFDCAINDKIFPQCAVYTNGQLNAIQTYRRYYKTKTSWKMNWRCVGEPLWFKSPQEQTPASLGALFVQHSPKSIGVYNKIGAAPVAIASNIL